MFVPLPHTTSVHPKYQILSNVSLKDGIKSLDEFFFFFWQGRGIVIVTKNSFSALHGGLLQATLQGSRAKEGSLTKECAPRLEAKAECTRPLGSHPLC